MTSRRIAEDAGSSRLVGKTADTVLSVVIATGLDGMDKAMTDVDVEIDLS